MTYWDGNRWIPEEPAAPRRARGRVRRRLLGASTEAALITLLMFGLIAGTTLAAKGGNGKGPANKEPTGSCQVNGNTVSGSGLPADQVLNFMVTEDGRTWGWVLGFAGETGAWDVTVPQRTGPTTYEFASRTYGVDGSKYEVFASCSSGA
jgi:hypothetical protein